MSKKLTGDQTLQFVSLYRKQVCLWDITSEHYKNKDVRQSALQEVCENMQIDGFTVDDVKHKIKSIRSTYYLELDKIKKSSRLGSNNSGKVYQPKVKWFNEFNSFIKNAMVKRKTQDNTVSDSVNPTETPCETPTTPEPQRKKSKISQLSTLVTNLKEMQYDLSKSGMEEDEFDVFGKHVANQLRKLSAEQAITGQEEIQNVITKCLLNDLRCRNTTCTFQATGTRTIFPSISPPDNEVVSDEEDVKLPIWH